MGHHQMDWDVHQGNHRGTREEGQESTFKETVSEKFPNLEKEVDIQIKEVQKY